MARNPELKLMVGGEFLSEGWGDTKICVIKTDGAEVVIHKNLRIRAIAFVSKNRKVCVSVVREGQVSETIVIKKGEERQFLDFGMSKGNEQVRFRLL